MVNRQDVEELLTAIGYEANQGRATRDDVVVLTTDSSA